MMRVKKFRGLRTESPPQSIPPEQFVVDEGTEKFEQDRIRRRAGMRHANVNKFTGPITAQIGIDMPGTKFAFLLVAGTDIYGIRQVGVL